MESKIPFSCRTIKSKWVQNDFPNTARTALIHLLYDLVDQQYVNGWIDIDKELRRIAREQPRSYDRQLVISEDEARISAENILESLDWAKIFDFCERLYSPLASDVRSWDGHYNDWEINTSIEEVRKYINTEVQRLFFEENLSYSFIEGEVRQRGRSHTKTQILKAEPTLGDPRLNNARVHYAKALAYFEHSSKPDFENAVKEAVCAVEAAARQLFPQTDGKTLGEIIKRIKGTQAGQLPKPLADTIIGLYAYRNSGDGVSHGGSDGGKVTRFIAEYALALAASQIILLHEVAAITEAEVPF